jgi:tripartite-type tricarboxylate transporter receptor subunit TctC
MTDLTRRHLLMALAAAGAVPSAWSSGFPDKPVKIVVPYPPGGGGDGQSRMVSAGVDLGQPVIVENRPGANGALGSRLVAGAPADGHTLLFTTATQLLLTPLLTPEAGFTAADFAPVCGLSSQPMFIVVPGSSPIKSLAELLQRGRAPDARMSYGSASIGSLSHVTGERLNAAAGTKFLHVPYKGTGQMMTAILSGELDYSFVVGGAAAAHMRNGGLRTLAVIDSQRSPAFPDVPTVKEAGGPDGFTQTAWYALVAPAKTPRPVIEVLHRKISAVFKRPDIKAKLEADSSVPWPATPDELAAAMKAEAPIYAQAVKYVK